MLILFFLLILTKQIFRPIKTILTDVFCFKLRKSVLLLCSTFTLSLRAEFEYTVFQFLIHNTNKQLCKLNKYNLTILTADHYGKRQKWLPRDYCFNNH